MININHIAIWTHDLERLKNFYIEFFEAGSGDKYHNKNKGFESYFLTFPSGPRLEIMKSIKLESLNNSDIQNKLMPGYAHMAFSLGSKEAVENLTDKLLNQGYKHVDGPRTTGDGYYESVVQDPDGNLIELTI